MWTSCRHNTVSRIDVKLIRGLAVSSSSSCCDRSAAVTTLRLTAGAGGAMGAATACTIWVKCLVQGLLVAMPTASGAGLCGNRWQGSITTLCDRSLALWSCSAFV